MELKPERPDQPRFDHFSRHFEEVDEQLEMFGGEFSWNLIRNPLCHPGRELCQTGEARILFGIYLEGNWLTLNPSAPFLHTAGMTAIYNPVPDMRFLRINNFAEHETFEYVKANLDDFLHRAVEFARECRLPTLTEEGCYAVPEGWCVMSSDSLRKRALEKRTTTTPTVENLRGAIAKVFRSWEDFPGAISRFRITSVMDVAQDCYTLTHVDFENRRYKSNLLAHLEIRDSKIWILTDNTEEGIATELVEAGIPKSFIVLGYYPPVMREMGEFAVA